MASARTHTLDTTKPQIPLAALRQDMAAASLKTGMDRQLNPSQPANRSQRKYQDWITCCAVELKKTDGLSSADRFFCAAFSLLFAGKQRADLDRAIDQTIDAETSQENQRFSLQPSPKTGGAKVRTKKYVAGYFAPDEKRNREKRFHDAVLFLLHEGFTRDQLHRLAAQAEES